ncbi:hypothetical protein K443DRAFT_686770 [Laccaria amethystina LaAM-08-1]|uniref:Uncharacterized protein n=1 Tax=Laccaria amethystina LaAM-08-1 TaxID=1095629 RepID=A0A0C9X1I1_9AGAR|nr:hypothetical protein K443DRAFT_686770 [Laccaria amethystina LaAM-08-1]
MGILSKCFSCTWLLRFFLVVGERPLHLMITGLRNQVQLANYNSNCQDTKLPQYPIRLGVSESKILKLDIRNAKFREEGG